MDRRHRRPRRDGGGGLRADRDALVEKQRHVPPTGGIRVEAERDGDTVRLHVIDTGVGIAREHQGRLFEEFFQVRNPEPSREKGFGLGLAIAKRMARQLGGGVTVASSPGHGSRFSIVLPATVAEHSEKPEAVQAAPTSLAAVPAGA